MLKYRWINIIPIMCMISSNILSLPCVATDTELEWKYCNHKTIYENFNGNAETEVKYQLGTFVVITDKNGIDTSELTGTLFCDEVHELQPDALNFLPIDISTKNRYYIVNIPLTEIYTEGDKEYIRYNNIITNGLYSPEIRKYIDESENVIDIIEVSFETIASAEWNGDFTARLIGIDELPLDNSILFGYEEAISELNALKKILNEYEILEKAKEKANSLTEMNQEVCYIVEEDVKITPDMNQAIYYTKSAIESAGDANMDNNVDASDAAIILMDSATYGSTANHLILGKAFAAADINNDDEVNALDASLVLEKAARNGVGQN